MASGSKLLAQNVGLVRASMAIYQVTGRKLMRPFGVLADASVTASGVSMADVSIARGDERRLFILPMIRDVFESCKDEGVKSGCRD